MRHLRLVQQHESATDETLVARACSGDESASAELVERYRREIHGFVYHLLGDAEEADDVTQEVFVQALVSLGRFRSDRRFAPWLYGIASHVTQLARRRLRRRGPSLEEANAASPLVADVSAWPDHAYAKEERRRRIRTALRALPTAYAEVVVLRYFGRLSYQAMAERLEVTESTVRMRLFRARDKLRQSLADLREGESP